MFVLKEPPNAQDQQKGNRRDQNGRAQVKTNNTAYSDSQPAEPYGTPADVCGVILPSRYRIPVINGSDRRQSVVTPVYKQIRFNGLSTHSSKYMDVRSFAAAVDETVPKPDQIHQ